MPCMGPSRDQAFKEADIICKSEWEKLVKKNHLYFSEDNEQKMKKLLRKTIRKFFWTSACDGF